MNAIPTPSQAAELRVLYAGNPVVNVAYQALLVLHVERVEDAAQLLETWAHTPELSPREYRAVLARFVPAPGWTSGTCGGAR